MPPLPKLRTPALAKLAEQLRYTPRAALMRDIERTEELASDVNAEQSYPLEWVVFRISGYRTELDAEVVVSGKDLLGDLSAFVERLCAQAGLRVDEHDAREYVAVEALEREWGVSRSTINRHRRRGLIARRVLGPDGRPRLIFIRSVVERHESRRQGELKRAASYTRIEEGDRERMVRRARRYRESCDLSLNEAALRLSRRFGRSHEAVRQILRRHDERSSEPIFEDGGPLTDRQRRVIVRASARGLEPGEIAKRFRRSSSLVRRVIADMRAERLRGLLEGGALAIPTSARLRDEVWLEAPAARVGLSVDIERDVLDLVSLARTQGRPDAEREASLSRAYHGLRARAEGVIRALPAHGASSAQVDRAETDLRWAGLVKLALAREQMVTILRAIEDRAGCRAERVGATGLAELMLEGLQRLGSAIDHFNPERGGRLAGATSVAVGRALGKHPQIQRIRSRSTGAASSKLVSLDVGDWRGRVVVWWSDFGPDPRLCVALDRLPQEQARLLAERYGLRGQAPRTLAEVASERGRAPMHVARREREALRCGLRLARLATTNPSSARDDGSFVGAVDAASG